MSNYLIVELLLSLSLLVSFSNGRPINTDLENDDMSYILIGAGRKYQTDSRSDLFNRLSKYSNNNASLNEYIDRTCNLIAVNENLETVKLPERSGHFFMFQHEYYNGKLHGLRTITRRGACFVNYEVKLLLAVSKFNFKQIQVSYDVLWKILFMKMHYNVKLTMEDVNVETAVLVDAMNVGLTMDRLVIPHVKKIKFKITGESILGWILDKIMAVINFIFRNLIIQHIENVTTDSIQRVFDNLPTFNRTDHVKVSPYCGFELGNKEPMTGPITINHSVSS